MNSYFQQIVDAVRRANHIAIVGPPGSGKSELMERLKQVIEDRVPFKFHYIATDDYQQHGWDKSMDVCYEDCARKLPSKFIVEGVQTARMLRRSLTDGLLSFDLIIKIDIPDDDLKRFYAKRNPEKSYPTATKKGIETVWSEYWNKAQDKPLLIQINEPI